MRRRDRQRGHGGRRRLRGVGQARGGGRLRGPQDQGGVLRRRHLRRRGGRRRGQGVVRGPAVGVHEAQLRGLGQDHPLGRDALRVHERVRVALGGGGGDGEVLRRPHAGERVGVEGARGGPRVVQDVLEPLRVVVLDVLAHVGGVGVGAHEGAQAADVVAVVDHPEVAPDPRRAPRRAHHAHHLAHARAHAEVQGVRRQGAVVAHALVVHREGTAAPAPSLANRRSPTGNQESRGGRRGLRPSERGGPSGGAGRRGARRRGGRGQLRSRPRVAGDLAPAIRRCLVKHMAPTPLALGNGRYARVCAGKVVCVWGTYIPHTHTSASARAYVSLSMRACM